MMRSRNILLALIGLAILPLASAAADDALLASLQGVWNAQSMEVEGKPGPAEALKHLRFTFDGKMLLVRGNHGDEREEQCQYKIDSTKTPKELDVTPVQEQMKLQGIFDLQGDVMTVCVRRGGGGRPTSFDTTTGQGLVKIIFKKQP